jgi:BMFP domain-containing protein YqiC
MSEDQFTKLFKYMQTEFESTRSDIQKVRQDVQRVYEVVDGDTYQREIDDHERAALGLQLDRLEKRIATLEKKLA